MLAQSGDEMSQDWSWGASCGRRLALEVAVKNWAKNGQIVSTCFYLFTSDLNLDLKAQAKARGRDDPSQRAVDSMSVLRIDAYCPRSMWSFKVFKVPMDGESLVPLLSEVPEVNPREQEDAEALL